ncbi:MAG: methionyl-tRNA formyltransferase [Neomegalonema sp.]|nr:methionyl-tRNA formyltransferase [Neomegalonema sp.]
MRLVFMGTPDFSVPVLEALVAAGHEIAAVYSQPPRPAGRGKKLSPSPVQLRAESFGIEVRTPLNFKAAADREAFAALDVDAAVVVAYGLLLPQAVLDAPRLGCFNLHASLLPRWRGAAPIQRAIMAGDDETGVCVMRMELGLDTGPVLLCERTPIAHEDTAQSLHDRLAQIGAPLMVEALDALAKGTAREEIQSEIGVEYARKIDKAEARIDWSLPAEALSAHIRGLSPFPGAWFELNGERIKVLLCRAETSAQHAEPGAALDDALLIACGSGALRLLTLQRAGKGRVSAADLLRGFPVPAGTRLSA